MAEVDDVHICFIGDCFINGVGDPDYLGWVGRLCSKSSGQSFKLTNYNLGIRGDTSIAVADRWHAECETRLDQVKNPRLVFSFGVNDTVMREGIPRVPFSQSLDSCSNILSSAKRTYPVLMVGPPPIDDPEQNERILRLDAAFEALCADLRVDYLSIYPLLVNEKIWMEDVANNDGSHPQAAGYSLYADKVFHWNAWWYGNDSGD